MNEEMPKELGDDIDPETGGFVLRPESEFSAERMERLRARIYELLESDIEATVASLQAADHEEYEEFQLEIDLETALADNQDVSLTNEELESLKKIMESDRAQEIYHEYNLKFLGAAFGPGHIDKSEIVFSIRLGIQHEPKELSAELVKLRFSNICAHCKLAGVDNEIVIEDTVPTSSVGKWKKGKGKDKGREYRDWDYGEVECPKCADRGDPSKVFLYYREYRDL